MKQRLFLFIVLISMIGVKALAYDVKIDGIYYTFSNGEAQVVKSYNYSGNIIIPEYVFYNEVKYSVTSISDEAFYGCSNLTNVTIPSSVKSIGKSAFAYCSNLTNMTIPNSVTSIGVSVFQGCSGLTSIILPNSVTSIGDYALFGCSGLTEVTIPNTVTSIGVEAFMNCSGLTSLTIPNSVKNIGQACFRGCSGLSSITIPSSITNIEVEAFRECSGLTSVTIQNGIKSIRSLAFYLCVNLKSLTIPNSITDITPGAFQHCGNLNSVVVDNGNAKYDSRNDCNAIIETATNTMILGCKSTIIPNDVTCIGVSAFSECTNLTSLAIPNSVTNIERYAFMGCTGLLSITIPNSVKSIGEQAFMWCSNLIAVDIPNNMTIINSQVFRECTSLTSVTIPSNVSSIGWGAFYGCSSLKSIVVENGNSKYDSRNNCNAIIESASNTLVVGCKNTFIPISVEGIGESAFDGCTSLISITIPSSITYIGGSAFRGCTGLTSVMVELMTPVSIGRNSFSNRTNATLYIPKGSMAAYESADYWKEFNEIVETDPIITFADDNVKSICVANWDTNGDGELSETEAAAVTDLGEIFKRNENITSFDELQYFTGLTSIGDYDFLCSSITSVIIPIGVTTINDYAFHSCSNLSSIIISDGVESIGNHSFSECSNLVSVTFPNSLTSIGSYALAGCSSITNITIPQNVKTIGEHAFANCSELIIVNAEMALPIAITSNTFSNATNAILFVPVDSKIAYEGADYWKDFGTILEQGTVLTEKDRIFGDDVNVYIGYTADLHINMLNETIFTAYQFDLVLPDGITIAKNENDKYIVSKGNRYSDDSHQVSIEDLGNNTFRFICVSLHNGIINGTEEALLSISLKANAEMTEGKYEATIKNIIMTTGDEKRYNSNNCSFTIETMTLLKGDANGDNEIDVIDVVCIINYIMGNPSENFNMLAADINDDGEVDIFDVMKTINLALTNKNAARSMARATRSTDEQAIITPTTNGVTLGVNDASRFTAFQFDVEVDEGIVLKDAILNENTGNHKIYFIKNGQNTYRVIGVSMDNSTLVSKGNDLVELRVSNSSKIQISNIVFITPQEDRIHFAAGSADVTGISDIKASQAEEVFDLSGRKLDTDRSRLPKGVYIINNKKVVIK